MFDNILNACFLTRARPLTYIQVYTVTEQASLENKEDFYEVYTIKRIQKSDIVVLNEWLSTRASELLHR